MSGTIFALETVSGLLGDQARAFSDVYKLYGFNDNQAFSEYLDFFLHEPVAWFEGLPSSLKSKASFAKPKTALSKALKHDNVIAAIGAEACEHAISVLWSTYKKEADRIVASRGGDKIVATVATDATDATEEESEPLLHVNEIVEEPRHKATMRSRKQKTKEAVPAATENSIASAVPEGTAMSFEVKYRVVDRAFRALCEARGTHDAREGANEAILVLLDALREA